MVKNKGQINLQGIFKALVTAIIGIIFLSALAPIVAENISQNFINLGIFLIVAGVIVAIISLIRPQRFF